MVSVLYIRKDSVYKTLDVDCWDIDRDARLYPGSNPVVAHPPSRTWGRMRHLSTAGAGEHALSVLAVHQVRTYGGVLEHPNGSGLWGAIPLPGAGEIDEYGGYSLSVDQHWWGHRAKKSSMLYIVGTAIVDVPIMPLSFDAIEFVVGGKGKSGNRKELPKSERDKTPLAFAKWLIQLAEGCIPKRAGNDASSLETCVSCRPTISFEGKNNKI